jgi:hypothetical protein
MTTPSKVTTSPEKIAPTLNDSSDKTRNTSHVQSQTRIRTPLPIIDTRTGKEIYMDQEYQPNSRQNTGTQYSPAKTKSKVQTPPGTPSHPVNSHSRNPLPIINPKTGEIVSNPVSPPTHKKAIPIIDPATGAELESTSVSSSSPRKNIIKKPFTVMINRHPPPQKKPPTTQSSSSNHGYHPQPPTLTILKKQEVHPQLYNPYQSSSSTPSVWNKPKPAPEWFDHSSSHLHHNQIHRHREVQHHHHTKSLPFNFSELEDEEEESEVDKYEWTCVPRSGFGMSFLDDDECTDSQVIRLKDRQVSVW